MKIVSNEIHAYANFDVALDPGFASFEGDYLFVSDMSHLSTILSVYPLKPFVNSGTFTPLEADVLPVGYGPRAYSFNPRQSRLVISTDDGEAWVYRLDPERGRMNREHRIQADEGKIVGVRFATDKQLILVSNRGTVISVDCDSGQTVWTTALHSFTFKELDSESSAAQVVASPTGRYLAIADDTRVQLFDTASGLPLTDPLVVERLAPASRPATVPSPGAQTVQGLTVADTGVVTVRSGAGGYVRQPPLPESDIRAEVSRVHVRTAIRQDAPVKSLESLMPN
jgi:outer membrane protein assembly factor BamB